MAVYLYVGSFCPKGDAGYSIFRFDAEHGTATPLAEDIFPEISAGTVTFDSRRNILYCTDERPTNPLFQQGGGGRVFALSVAPDTGLLSEVNHALSYGARPSYATIDKDGKHLIVTNFGASKHAGVAITQVYQDEAGVYHTVATYDQATTVLYSLEPDGSIGPACDVFHHLEEGTPNPRVPHAHCVQRSPDGRFFAVCEMGTDKVYLFSIDPQHHKLTLPGGAPYHYQQGYGPRYCAFHPTKPFLFVNTEDIPTVASFQYDEHGHLKLLCSVDVMPEGHEPTPELHSGFTMSADGRFLYSAMRKFNIITVFSVNQETGQLTRLQTCQLSGVHPKDCALSPDGQYLAVANRRSDTVELFRVAKDGTLISTNTTIHKNAAGLVFFLSF